MALEPMIRRAQSIRYEFRRQYANRTCEDYWHDLRRVHRQSGEGAEGNLRREGRPGVAGGLGTTVQFDEQLASSAQIRLAVKGAGYGLEADPTPQSQRSKGGCCA